MEFETLETNRLILKKITPEIFTDLFSNRSDSELKELLGLTTDVELMTERKKSLGGYVTYDRTIVAFLLTLKETGETIGRCGYHNWYADHHKAEIGYVLTKEACKNKGYMSEAVEVVLGYGFNNMHLNRVEACVGPANIPSLNIIRKYGFTQEGYLRKHFVRNGEVQDTLIFSLLKEEYEELKNKQ